MVFEGEVEIGLEDPCSLFYFYLLVQRGSKTNDPIEHYGSIIFFHDVHADSLSIVTAFSLVSAGSFSSLQGIEKLI